MMGVRARTMLILLSLSGAFKSIKVIAALSTLTVVKIILAILKESLSEDTTFTSTGETLMGDESRKCVDKRISIIFSRLCVYEPFFSFRKPIPFCWSLLKACELCLPHWYH